MVARPGRVKHHRRLFFSLSLFNLSCRFHSSFPPSSPALASQACYLVEVPDQVEQTQNKQTPPRETQLGLGNPSQRCPPALGQSSSREPAPCPHNIKTFAQCLLYLELVGPPLRFAPRCLHRRPFSPPVSLSSAHQRAENVYCLPNDAKPVHISIRYHVAVQSPIFVVPPRPDNARRPRLRLLCKPASTTPDNHRRTHHRNNTPEDLALTTNRPASSLT